ncbi:hypothetical protein JMUB6875_34320 [Nocardia sp. JMUB6875]|uniref:hypothetical protein n=1 Tax=Nocardia sp. JMUB6875 TaxID=3158170 RepID=UPI0032E61A9E
MSANTEDSVSQDNSTAESPDVGFRMGGEPAAAMSTVDEDDLVERVAGELLALLPEGWERLDAAIAMTASDEAAQVIVSSAEHVAQVALSARAIELLRELRALAAESEEGPWWRILVSVTPTGSARIEYDYGAEPFPDHHLFPPQAYLADLREYPRKRLPVWLGAYIGHGDRQVRTPQTAFTQAQADSVNGMHAFPVGDGLPSLPAIWARWAVISAVFVAAKTPLGPRVTSALGWFEGASRSGSTLHRLPNGKAVLSGGVWDAPELDAVYNGGAPMPEHYRGAPDWVADPVLSPRASNGLMSFCYWWDGYAWYQGESPAPNTLRDALPGIWSSDSAFDVIAQVIGNNASSWITALVAAAESGSVTRAQLSRALPGGEFDLDSAYYQLILAGIAS